jgi:hypothetical protein
MHVRTTATELAQWLELQGGAWHVEGEPVLSKSLPLPTTASSLVHVLRKRGSGDSDLAVLAPEPTTLPTDAVVTARDIAGAAHVIDGKRVFQLAWVLADGSVADSWLLVEEPPSPGRSDNGAARSVVDAFRASLTDRTRR